MATEKDPVNCPDCQPLFTALIHGSWQVDFHKTIADLEAGSRRGCEVCHLQCCLLNQKERGRMLERNCSHTYVHLQYDPNNEHWKMNWYYRYHDPTITGNQNWTSFGSGVVLVPAVGDDEVASSIAKSVQPRWETVRYWIKTCDEKHERCQMVRSRTKGKLPTRLVETGVHGAVRVRLGEDLPFGTKFCTLSHCWGKHVPLKLLKGNIDELQGQIPTEALSKTFRDALCAARLLGIEFIWIDSLCIVQDDAEDWRRESSKMANIYEASYFNIAATHASDGSQGFFPFIKHRTSGATKVIASLSGSSDAQAGNVPKEEYADIVELTFESHLWHGEVRQAPLLTRGWVLQELVLTPRVLHCGQNELFWECEELSASEDYPGGIPGIDSGKDSLFQSNHTSLDELSTLWHKMVRRFSELSLTFPEKDKLVAIEGLARRLIAPRSSVGGSNIDEFTAEYLYGLWRFNLTHDLLWFVPWYHPVSADDRTWDDRSLSAPSWSWASCNQLISYNDDDSDMTNDSRAFDPTTELGSILADIDGSTTTQSIAMTACIGIAEFRDRGDSSDRYNRSDRLLLLPSSSTHICANAHFDRSSPETRTSSILYVPVLAQKAKRPAWSSPSEDDRWYIEGLIVQPANSTVKEGSDSSCKREYQRLGYFCLYMEHKHLLQGLKESQESVYADWGPQEHTEVNSFGFRRWRIDLV